MEDKTFELLEKMYSEMQNRFVRLENKMDESHKALYDMGISRV